MEFFKKLNSDIFVKIEKYQPIMKKGNLSGQCKIFLKDLFREKKIKSGSIAVKGKKIDISGIKETAHQQIRNIILNVR